MRSKGGGEQNFLAPSAPFSPYYLSKGMGTKILFHFGRPEFILLTLGQTRFFTTVKWGGLEKIGSGLSQNNSSLKWVYDYSAMRGAAGALDCMSPCSWYAN